MVSDRAWRLRAYADNQLREKWAKERAEYRRKLQPTIAQALYPNLRTDTPPRPVAREGKR